MRLFLADGFLLLGLARIDVLPELYDFGVLLFNLLIATLFLSLIEFRDIIDYKADFICYYLSAYLFSQICRRV